MKLNKVEREVWYSMCVHVDYLDLSCLPKLCREASIFNSLWKPAMDSVRHRVQDSIRFKYQLSQRIKHEIE
jgi:hypothetical protein